MFEILWKLDLPSLMRNPCSQFGSGGMGMGSNYSSGNNINGLNPFGANPGSSSGFGGQSNFGTSSSNYNTNGFGNTSSADGNPFAATVS